MSSDQVQRDTNSTGFAMVRKSRWRELFLMASALALLALGFWIWQPFQKTPPIRLRISAGSASGPRHQIALSLASNLADQGLLLDVVPSNGSEESLEWLEKHQIDLALVQGGIVSTKQSRIRQLCPLMLEPLHLLVQAELGDEIRKSNLLGLRGKRVNLGAGSSGTRLLAEEILEFLDLQVRESEAEIGSNDSRDFVLADHLSYEELKLVDSRELPDAIFVVSSMPSPLAHWLIENRGFQLVGIPFGTAFSQSSTIDDATSHGRKIDRHFYSPCSIPAYSYGVDPDTPDSDLPTIGSRMLLVANSKVPDGVIERTLTGVLNTDFTRNTIPGLDASWLDLPNEYVLHTGVQRYRDRNKVLIASDLIDYLEKLLAIIATLAGAAFFLYQWYSEHRRQQRENRFGDFMMRVIKIEQESLQSELSAKLQLADLIRLQKELADLKEDAVKGFVTGEWQSPTMLNGLLALINDTREQITRLILHERENIEQDAEKKHVQPDMLWRHELEVQKEPTDPQGPE
ncbi:MAG: TAXI family TRAP transporter solute-binding subunit [Pirellula sp.]|jgi:TRAP-type uncharacterized transport system substrate-binding protein